MGQALYRKYRSKTLDEVIGQEHITTTLNNALNSGSVSHAYLFTGPRGVGKTSVARILAHAVNNLEYSEPVTHLDIIEIDAASNRRIDEIRELRDKVSTVPTSTKYKVYIIDEVHMLTREAFNALLKTLEEPPDHAIFILATTESHKLPETIISRTQHFTFKPISSDQVAEHLLSIAESEGISLEDDAALLIANYGQGSFRDSLTLLDRLKSSNSSITTESVRTAIGLAPDETIKAIIIAAKEGSTKDVMITLDRASSDGYNAVQVAQQLSDTIRNNIQESNGITLVDLDLLKQLIEVPASQNPNSTLELILLRYQLALTGKESTQVANDKVQPAVQTNNKVDINDEGSSHATPEKSTNSKIDNSGDEIWDQALLALKKDNNALYSIARMAEVLIDDTTITLTLQFPFHLKRMMDTKNDTSLKKVINNISGVNYEIKYVLAENPKQIQNPKSESNNNLKSINDIFGETEMLES